MLTCCRKLAAALLPLLALSGVAAPGRGEEFTPPKIRVPEGFTVELAAGPPLVKHPMMACFDDRGRLYVAESAGENLRRNDLEARLPNFIRRLEDTNGDGRFDRSTIFADQMTQPMGAAWLDGALYVASPPSIWRLEDTDDDGVADRRRELVTQFSFNGNAASVHGCFVGPTGRLFWTHARRDHHVQDAAGGTISQGNSAGIFSCQPDGSDVRQHCGGGMDNPVEVDFMPTGECLGTVNLFYRRRGDCLVHWMHGGAYPRFDQAAVTDRLKRTGDLLPEAIDLGHVAVSGMNRLRSANWGGDYQHSLFITQFNTHDMVRAVLERDGGTYKGRVEPFLTFDSDDAHPTDVLEDADGSLLVIDTGGWFRIGCPTSQIAKPNVLGAIYRVRKTDARPPSDPRGLQLDWNAGSRQLAGRLADPRWTVRERAIETLARRDDAVPAVTKLLTADDSDPNARRRAVWVAARVASAAGDEAIRSALEDADADVRLAAAHAAGMRSDSLAVARLIQFLSTGEAALRREAATALGRIGDARAVPALLAAMTAPADRVTEHALIYALIELNAPTETLAGLAHPDARTQRGALIALDQMNAAPLTQRQVAPLLDAEDGPLQQAAVEIFQRHPAWSGELVELFTGWLSQPSVPAERLRTLRGGLLVLIDQPAVQQLVGRALDEPETSRAVADMLLEVVARCGQPELPPAWVPAIRRRLTPSQPAQLELAIAAAAPYPLPTFDEQLHQIAGAGRLPAAIRLQALAALAGHRQALTADEFGFLAAQLAAPAPPDRLTAAGAIGAAKLTAEQQLAVAERIAVAGPLELRPLLAAYETLPKEPDARLGPALAAALSRSPGLTSLSASSLEQLFARFPGLPATSTRPLLARLNANFAEQQARLEELQQSLSDGDAGRGQKVFLNRRVACAVCHSIAGQGGQIGPDLTKIGARRSTRDLLEAILYPSASFARGYESYALHTDAGRVHTGLIVRETPELLFLRTTQQQDIRLRRDAVEEMLPSPTSIMPQGLDKNLTPEELQDLIAYLKSLK